VPIAGGEPAVAAFSAAVKSKSRALKPGVSAFAILEDSSSWRCARNTSALP
jgi:hypothetical protein